MAGFVNKTFDGNVDGDLDDSFARSATKWRPSPELPPRRHEGRYLHFNEVEGDIEPSELEERTRRHIEEEDDREGVILTAIKLRGEDLPQIEQKPSIKEKRRQNSPVVSRRHGGAILNNQLPRQPNVIRHIEIDDPPSSELDHADDDDVSNGGYVENEADLQKNGDVPNGDMNRAGVPAEEEFRYMDFQGLEDDLNSPSEYDKNNEKLRNHYERQAVTRSKPQRRLRRESFLNQKSSVLQWARKTSGGEKVSRVASGMMALILTIIGLGLSLCEALPPTKLSTLIFFVIMHITAFIMVGALLLLGASHLLAEAKEYKWKVKSKIDFLRAGAMILGSGNIIYECLRIAAYVETAEECRNQLSLLSLIASVIFTFSQIYLLIVYSRIEIHASLITERFACLAIAFITATNLCVWYQTLVYETTHDIHLYHHKAGDGHHGDGHGNGHDNGAHDVHRRAAAAAPVATVTEPAAAPIANTTSKPATPPVQAPSNITTPKPYDGYGPGHETPKTYSQLDCIASDNYEQVFSSYLYPCTIEYSIVCATMMYAIWTTIGAERRNLPHLASIAEQARNSCRRNNKATEVDNHSVLSEESDVIRTVSHTKMVSFDSRLGLFLSHVTFCVTVIIVIIYLFSSYNQQHSEEMNTLIFVTDVLLNLVVLLAIPFVSYRMRDMKTKTEQMSKQRLMAEKRHYIAKNKHRKHMDKGLLVVAFCGLLINGMLSLIAAGMLRSWLLFFENLIAITSACLQTGFVIYAAMEKRSTTRLHAERRPGRQGLELMRGVNLALWILKTFAIKKNEANSVQIEFFSFPAWSVLSHIFMPLGILFRFHSCVCISDAIEKAYSTKYIRDLPHHH